MYNTIWLNSIGTSDQAAQSSEASPATGWRPGEKTLVFHVDWGFFIGTGLCQVCIEMAGLSISILASVVLPSRESVLKVGVRCVHPRVPMSRKRVPIRKATLLHSGLNRCWAEEASCLVP